MRVPWCNRSKNTILFYFRNMFLDSHVPTINPSKESCDGFKWITLKWPLTWHEFGFEWTNKEGPNNEPCVMRSNATSMWSENENEVRIREKADHRVDRVHNWTIRKGQCYTVRKLASVYSFQIVLGRNAVFKAYIKSVVFVYMITSR